jgi:hypothetical protein
MEERWSLRRGAGVGRHPNVQAVSAGAWKFAVISNNPADIFMIGIAPYETTNVAKEQPTLVAMLTSTRDGCCLSTPRGARRPHRYFKLRYS